MVCVDQGLDFGAIETLQLSDLRLDLLDDILPDQYRLKKAISSAIVQEILMDLFVGGSAPARIALYQAAFRVVYDVLVAVLFHEALNALQRVVSMSGYVFLSCFLYDSDFPLIVSTFLLLGFRSQIRRITLHVRWLFCL